MGKLLGRALSFLRPAKQEPAKFRIDRRTHIDPQDIAEAIEEFELANRALSEQQFSVARQHLLRALELNPDLAEAHANLGALLKDLGEIAGAEIYLARAVELNPALSQACFNLGLLRIYQGRWADAAHLFQRVLARESGQADAHYWLANALMGMGDAQRARQFYRSASRLQPTLIQAQWGYVMAQLPAVSQTFAEQEQAPKAFAKALNQLRADWRNRSLDELYPAVGAQQPYFLAYIGGNHRSLLQAYGSYCVELMQVWMRQESDLPALRSTSGRKCRLAIVSAHVHSHSVWHALLKGWIQHLDPNRFELHLFHMGSRHDAETDWAGRHVKKLYVGQRSWQEWARLIAQTQPDVLIYPEVGMDATTVRLASLRLARVQYASWGHPITTGLPTIDAYISAEALEPPDAQNHYTESLVRLPRLGCSYMPYGTSAQAPDLLTWGINASDRVLLSPGVPYKYSPQHDRIWVELVRQCQPCKLVFFSSSNESLSAEFKRRLQDAFVRAGVSFEAGVRFIPWQPQAQFFGWLDKADVFLDTIGFSGFNTAIQAVERGAPIVAYEGEEMRGRFASALLRQLGLEAYVAQSVEQYISLVQGLLQSPAAAAEYRVAIAQRRGGLWDDRATVEALSTDILERAALHKI